VKRRNLPVAVALAASAALLLTACGGGGDTPEGNDKIAGAETGGTTSASPSASASIPADRPTITLPGAVKDVFDDWKTGDPTKDTALADAAAAQTAVNEAILKGTTDTPAMAFYYKGDALIASAKWVQKWLDAGLTYTGTTRYLKPEITMFDEKSAAVTFCADETQAYNKDRKTGKVDKTAPSDESYVLYSTRLEKNDEGVWQTSSGTSERGNAKCTP
jgi:hypothetical protein